MISYIPAFSNCCCRPGGGKPSLHVRRVRLLTGSTYFLYTGNARAHPYDVNAPTPTGLPEDRDVEYAGAIFRTEVSFNDIYQGNDYDIQTDGDILTDTLMASHMTDALGNAGDTTRDGVTALADWDPRKIYMGYSGLLTNSDFAPSTVPQALQRHSMESFAYGIQFRFPGRWERKITITITRRNTQPAYLYRGWQFGHYPSGNLLDQASIGWITTDPSHTGSISASTTHVLTASPTPEGDARTEVYWVECPCILNGHHGHYIEDVSWE